MSRTKLNKAYYSINELIKKHHNGAYATKAATRHTLRLTVEQCHEAGYKIAHIGGIKPKHIECVVSRWQAEKKVCRDD